MDISEKGLIVARLQEKTLNISKMLVNLQNYSKAYNNAMRNRPKSEIIEKAVLAPPPLSHTAGRPRRESAPSVSVPLKPILGISRSWDNLVHCTNAITLQDANTNSSDC